MAMFNRRSLLAALSATALSTTVLTACSSQGRNNVHAVARGISVKGAALIAQSYSEATGDKTGASVLAFLDQVGQADLSGIRMAMMQDFEAGRTFTHAGWRLSYTEGQLFTLLAV